MDKKKEERDKVDFKKRDGGKLTLCLGDIHEGNFRKHNDGRLYALDFGCTHFLPSAFQDLSIHKGKPFAQKVGIGLGCYSGDDHTWAILSKAAGALIMCGENLGVFFAHNNSSLCNRSHYVGLPRTLQQ